MTSGISARTEGVGAFANLGLGSRLGGVVLHTPSATQSRCGLYPLSDVRPLRALATLRSGVPERRLLSALAPPVDWPAQTRSVHGRVGLRAQALGRSPVCGRVRETIGRPDWRALRPCICCSCNVDRGLGVVQAAYCSPSKDLAGKLDRRSVFHRRLAQPRVTSSHAVNVAKEANCPRRRRFRELEVG